MTLQASRRTRADQDELDDVTIPAAPRNWLVIAIALATFGPYVLGSIRTEQVLVYGLLVLTLPFTLPSLHTRGGLRFIVPWTFYVLVASLSLLPAPEAIAPFRPGGLLAGYDNILLPLALMLLIWSLVRREHALSALQTFSKVIAVCASANGVLAVVGVVLDLTPFLRPFWTGDAAETVAERAAQMGRLGGIFNQPVEAGVMYGIAGIAAVYVWQRRPLLLALLLTFITLGGLLSVSKAFILGAMPFVIVYWLWSQRGNRRVVTILAALFGILGLMQSGVVEQWSGYNYLARLLNPTGGVVSFYSAGRFEDESAFNQVVEAALAHSPIVGVGPGGWAIAYDGAVAEALVVAGILGLLAYLAVVAAMFTLTKAGGEEGRFALFFAAIMLAGTLGFSPLTANRVATVAWVIIALLVLICADRAQAQADGTEALAPAPQPESRSRRLAPRRAVVREADRARRARRGRDPR